MQDAHGVATALDANVKRDIANNQKGKEPYQDSFKLDHRIVRLLIYAFLATQPDHSYVVAALCRYPTRLFTSHLTGAMSVLQYPQATTDFQQHFKGNFNRFNNGKGNTSVIYAIDGLTDSDWGSHHTDCLLHGGPICLLCHDGGALTCQLRKQNLDTLTTVTAE
jgi:hypothetical protein